MMQDKVILTDCDGVILDWEYHFNQWMLKRNYIVHDEAAYDIGKRFNIPPNLKKLYVRAFNESAWVGKMSPLRDAVKYVKKLHEEHGYVFHAITSLSDDIYAQELRTQNLKNLFGETAFEKFVYCDTGADKDDVLAPYEGSGCYWVEDKPENANLGVSLGLKSILVAHAHNADYQRYGVERVQNWKEIYSIITD